ncbi:MAG TPA: hypothetical protein VM578_00660 [Candidatus Saccharimonadales bacterium]|nr:hypothetical protein [Candidatus Saccharimonadales bacterium]
MGFMDQLSNVLKQYTGGAASAQVPANVNEHFDQVAQNAPPGVVANGLSEAFRSDQTPAFGQMVSGLFSQSNGEQKAGFLNHLIASAGPGVLAQIAGGGALAGLLNSGTKQLSPEQAQQVPPEVVQQIATHAEKTDPSIVDRASSFYAEHPTLVKTLGGAALSVALAKIAQSTSRAA